MKTKNNDRIKIWELSLLFALCISLCTGLWAHAQQQKLSSQLVRLHIIAESDSDEDQALKLKVRDSVLELLTPALEEAEGVADAQTIIEQRLDELREVAKKAMSEGGHIPKAEASLSVESYPTRMYDGFALPAGDYLSLRIILGEGKGHNWWCVVFPPLCMTAVEDSETFTGLSEDASELIVAEEGEYRLRFRVIELFELLRHTLT
ncbi:MAG: stage II sporulation protein R [Clostridiales bacterium]|nr:stage II sporulation protein R [Clostridiales bacterium]